MIRVAFFGTPGFAVPCLEALAADEHFQIVEVFSQPDQPAGRKMRWTPSLVKKRALELKLPVTTPEKCTNPEFIEHFASLNLDVAVVVAFGQILPQKLLDLLPQKFINVHASLLPRWRGAAPIQRAVMSGDLKSGVCLQVMVKKLDAGDILAEVATLIEPNETALSLHDRLSFMGAELITSTLPAYLKGEIKPQAQDATGVTYAHKIEKSESLIDWQQTAKQIHQNIRGLSMGPGSHTILQSKKLKIHRSLILQQDSEFQVGQISGLDSESFFVQTSKGQLQVLEVQPESKPRMSAKAYLAGNSLELGQKLGNQ